MQNFKLKKLWLAMALALPVAPVVAQDASSVNDAVTDEQTEDGNVALEKLEVTGSRLKGGDPTSRTYTITREDIERQGFSSAEDIVRNIPFNFSSINSGTNMEISSGRDTNLGALGLGISTVNLRGLGSAATLVLVNGRRVAGAAGNEEGFVNIQNLPASAIERVEIQIDGASAVYGADAVGGVINFIMRRDYQGGQVQGRYENSSTGGDRYRAAGTYGYSWEAGAGGNLTATLAYTKTEPVQNEKTGWTTRDLSDEFPGEDYRDFQGGQPAVMSIDSRWGPFIYTLPEDHDGTNWGVEDLQFNTRGWDHVPPENGADAETWNFTLFANHNINENVSIYGDFLYTENTSIQRFQLTNFFGVEVPASNYFNNTGGSVWVNYYPAYEEEMGLIPESWTDSISEQTDLNLGLEWRWGKTHRINFDVSWSQSDGESTQNRPKTFDREDPEFDARVDEILASSDPNVAVNLFGNGTVQNDTIGELFGTYFASSGTTELMQFTPVIRGEMFEMAGGGVNYALGMELRNETLKLEDDDYVKSRTGGKNPETDLTAYFFEIGLPLVSPQNARDFIYRFDINAQVRYDEYEMEGAVATDEMGNPILETKKFDNTSPRIGVAWGLTPGFTLRGSWSEGFRVPVFTELFNPTPFTFISDLYDPYAPGGPTTVFVPHVFAANPFLEPETSTNTAFGLDWTPTFWPGFRFVADWSKVDYTNRITSGSELKFNMDPGEFAALDLVVRDPAGNAILVNQGSVNQTARVSEILNMDISYVWNTSVGTFIPGLNYSKILNEYDQFSEDTTPVDRVGTSLGNDEYNVRARLRYNAQRWGADIWVNYTPEYRNISNIFVYQGQTFGNEYQVDDYTTVDLSAFYDFNNGLILRGGGRNIFDESFPRTPIQGKPYDAGRVDIRGRVLYADLTWEF